MFVPDLLHEFELGVWKNTFKHLIRILYAVGDDLIQELNSRSAQSKFLTKSRIDKSFRYRQIPTFGTSIRRFSSNASVMKKLAARDFEDLLQVCFLFLWIIKCVINLS